jgi:hypothetical protein
MKKTSKERLESTWVNSINPLLGILNRDNLIEKKAAKILKLKAY